MTSIHCSLHSAALSLRISCTSSASTTLVLHSDTPTSLQPFAEKLPQRKPNKQATNISPNSFLTCVRQTLSLLQVFVIFQKFKSATRIRCRCLQMYGSSISEERFTSTDGDARMQCRAVFYRFLLRMCLQLLSPILPFNATCNMTERIKIFF